MKTFMKFPSTYVGLISKEKRGEKKDKSHFHKDTQTQISYHVKKESHKDKQTDKLCEMESHS